MMRLVWLICTLLFLNLFPFVGSQLCRFATEGPTVISEGTEAVYAVELLSQPPAGVNVSILLTPLDDHVSIAAGAFIFFNSNNWNRSQNFILFGVNDDDILDSPYSSLVMIQSISNSLNFSTAPGGRFPNGTLTFLLQDSDRAGAELSIQEGFPSYTAIPEGRFSVYLVQLPSTPRSTVTLELRPVEQTIFLSHDIFTFQPNNWNISQAFLVFSVDDEINQGVIFHSNISFIFTSADPYYSDLILDDFPVPIEDNDEDSAVLSGVIYWRQSQDSRYGCEVTLSLTLDRSYFPDAREGGSVTLEGAKLDFGDGSSLGPRIGLNISKLYSTYLLASLTLSKQYSSACHLDGSPWSIQFSYCCRSKNLLANGLTMIILETEVNLAEPSSPVVPLLPPFYIQSNSSLLQSFFLPATASNGHPIQFSLLSSQGYLSSQAGAPGWVQIDTNTGLLSFNTSLLRQANGLTCFLVQVHDVVANLKIVSELCHYLTREFIPPPVPVNSTFLLPITAPRLYFAAGTTADLTLGVNSSSPLTIEPINPPSGASYAAIPHSTSYPGSKHI